MVDFMEIIFLGIGLLIGTIKAWFIAKYKFTNRNGSLNRNEINEKYVLLLEVSGSIPAVDYKKMLVQQMRFYPLTSYFCRFIFSLVKNIFITDYIM